MTNRVRKAAGRKRPTETVAAGFNWAAALGMFSAGQWKAGALLVLGGILPLVTTALVARIRREGRKP